jgi:hypothetical protein
MARRAAAWVTGTALTVTLVACGETNDGPRDQPPGAPTGTTSVDDGVEPTVEREVGPDSGSMPGMDD